MKKNKLGVLGASGRMGQEILRCLEGQTKFEAFLGWTSVEKDTGYKHSVTRLEPELVDKVDLWIDFSTPEALISAIPKISRSKKPVISGTTGMNDLQMKKLRSLSAHTAVMWSANMSLGIAVLMKTLETLQLVSHFDFQIEETHHRMKKDAPSGTALSLQKKLEKLVQTKLPPPVSIRGGGVVGVHKVWALGEEETLCFEHNALQRRVFARGALWAAERILKKSKGFYEFGDLLK